MYTPTFEEFREYAQEYDVVPVYREILSDMDTPVSALKKLARGESAFLLESVEGGERFSRYSFLGTEPSMLIEGRSGKVRRSVQSGQSPNGHGPAFDTYEDTFDDPLTYLETLMGEMRAPQLPGLPQFFGGAVGYLGYDVIKYFERVPVTGDDELGLPEFFFMFTDKLVVFDRLTHSMKVVSTAQVGKDKSDAALRIAYDQAIYRIEDMIEGLQSPTVIQPVEVASTGELKVGSNIEKGRFLQMVDEAKEHIFAGDIFQAVLSQRFSVPLHGDPFDLYRVLRRVNPSPYMYYLRHQDMTIIGSSPEPLVRVEGDQVLTRPIAGTRGRGKDHAEDLRLEQELLADEKERAEHIMLVDLGRNDLGRVCTAGTIEVDEFMTIERYSHVMHIVSSVVGKLAPGRTAFDVLRSAFPAGTVSGAPKIRAMEIIDELEPTRRGPYAGAVGYFGYGGSLDTCITIRTIVTKGDTAYVQAGAGIVADSVPEKEFLETENKARGLLASVELAYAGHV